MSVDLYEHYKDALRRGHIALAKGQLDAALDAYREAVRLAPDRAAPHGGIGQVLLRQDAARNALAAFDAALMRAPRDVVGLRGRAEALARLGRRTDAAAALDLLSDVQETAGRVADARDSTQQALDLAEQKARRRRLADLTRRLRLAAGATSAEAALAGTLRPLHEAVAHAAAADIEREVAADAGVDTAAAARSGARRAPWAADGGPVHAKDATGATQRVEPEAAPHAEDSETADAEGSADDVPEAATATQAGESAPLASKVEAEPEPEPAPEPLALSVEAERLLDAGDLAGARDRYLAAAVAFEAEGLLPAAIDACYVALAFAPDDAEVHLRLVELYLASGWSAPAADKLALLGRLTDLDPRQRRARAKIVILAADHFPDDPRLRRLTATR